MAITVSTSANGNGSQNATGAAGTALTVDVAGEDILPGEVIIVAIAADNANTSGTSSIGTPTDTKSHTYSLVSSQNRTAGSAANDGCTVALYSTTCTTQMVVATDSITANFAPATTAKVVRYLVLRDVRPTAFSTGGVSGSGTTYNSAGTATDSLAAGNIVIGAVASEHGTVPTLDSDTLNGSWTDATQTVGSGQNDTRVSVSLQYKIVTASGTQVLDGTSANSDWAVTWGLFRSPFSATADDSLLGSDTATGTTKFARTASETLLGADTITVSNLQTRTTTNSLLGADSPVALVAQSRTTANMLLVGDAAARTTSFPVTAADSFALTDSASRTVADQWTDGSNLVQADIKKNVYPQVVMLLKD